MEYIEENYKNLISNIKDYNPNPNLELISKAWEFAKIAHFGQKRLSGESVITHPLAVSNILADWKLDSTSITAGLLHDMIEDCNIKKEEIVKEFGKEVADLVEGVTKVRKFKLRGSEEEEFLENLRKMLLVMAKDLRVVFVRLADRLHNMQTLEFLNKKKRIRSARETLEIFAPLANRLGMESVKSQLEDLAFPYIYPQDYMRVNKESRIHYRKAENHIMKMKRNLLKELIGFGIKAKIDGRKKNIYSLWKKLQRPEIDGDYEKIHDIVALRVLVDTVAECYGSLGVVHNLYKPVPHLGISDFIAQPKPNGYKSIHTKIFGPGERIVEVQIRTFQMHDEAESGLAAHWYYSLKKTGKANEKVIERGFFAPSEKITWVRQLVEWQDTAVDSVEFMNSVKFDALSTRIYVFSPKGDVYELPLESTPVDFAYTVHTDLGEYIKGAKVNDKIVPLDYKLGSGQVVEIIKSKNPKPPNSNWLEFVVTNIARQEINKYFRNKEVDRK